METKEMIIERLIKENKLSLKEALILIEKEYLNNYPFTYPVNIEPIYPVRYPVYPNNYPVYPNNYPVYPNNYPVYWQLPTINKLFYSLEVID